MYLAGLVWVTLQYQGAKVSSCVSSADNIKRSCGASTNLVSYSKVCCLQFTFTCICRYCLIRNQNKLFVIPFCNTVNDKVLPLCYNLIVSNPSMTAWMPVAIVSELSIIHPSIILSEPAQWRMCQTHLA